MFKPLETSSIPPFEEWHAFVTSIKQQTQNTTPTLSDAVQQAVYKRLPSEPFGLLLSGGIDSTLIAYLLRRKTPHFTCYTVCMEGSRDVQAAAHAARTLDLQIRTHILNEHEVLAYFKKIKTLLPHADVITIGVGSVILAALHLAHEDGMRTVFTGLGSDSIFAGFHRHTRAPDANDECWNSLLHLHKDLVRDSSLAKHENTTLQLPYIDQDVIAAAMRIPSEKKVHDGRRKIILGELAEHLGLPPELAWRKKQAAQYGSRFDHLLQKLAKRAGKTKSGFLAQLT